MKAVVFHGVGDIRLDDVPQPRLKGPHDAIVRITASAICGTDLHIVRGTLSGMQPGTIIGHEAVGVVEEVGRQVRNLIRGDRVVITSTIGCGYCSYCRAGYFSQCDVANPYGRHAGTCFFGGPQTTGPIDGLQAEYARVPFANVTCVKLPDDVTDDQALLLSDIFPTGYFGADNAEIKPGDTVAVFGCGPVGLFAIVSAILMDAGRVIAVDRVPTRLELARELGAEIVNFETEEPVKAILELTGGIGVDRVIDAVGVDAVAPHHGPAQKESHAQKEKFAREQWEVAPKIRPDGELWRPGDAPSQVMAWAVGSVAKAGTLSVIGFYPQTAQFFPFGIAMFKNLTIKGGNCNHRTYIPRLIELVASGAVHPERILTQAAPLTHVLDAYKNFDTRREGWIKTELIPNAVMARRAAPPQKDKIQGTFSVQISTDTQDFKEKVIMAEPISKSVTVRKPVNEVFHLWSNFENFPHFMNNIKSVVRTGDRTSHWVMDGPLGKDIEWDAIISDVQENRRIAWNSTDQGNENDIHTTGEVRFRELTPNETVVTATVHYETKGGGGIKDALAKLFGAPGSKLENDLKNFKEFAEGTSPGLRDRSGGMSGGSTGGIGRS